MAVSSGQTAAQTQERGPKELHSAGPGRARPGRELRSVGFPLASPRYSSHRDHKSGLFAARLRLLGWRRSTPAPPPPRPARTAPGPGGLGGGGRENALGGRPPGVCTDLPIAVCSLTGVVWGGVYVRLWRLCGTGSNHKLQKGKNSHM